MWWALYRLRVLALPKQCDDDVASVVGLNCPKLECIILTGTAVTNVGLSWLLCCRQLHTLIMPGFFQGVTPKGNSYKGSFNNYVDIILPFFEHLSTSMVTFFILNVDNNWHFLITYHPPHLFHVVFERPLFHIW